MKIFTLLLTILVVSQTNLSSQYSLWTWGKNHQGELGNGRLESEPYPVVVNNDGDWEKVYPYYAIKSDSSLWTWGNRDVNILNNNENSKIRLFDDSKWIKIFTSGYGTTYGIKSDSSLWSWGRWNFGWLMSDYKERTKENSIIKEPILIDSTKNWKDITFTGRSCFGINNEGKLYVWGRLNYDSGLGIHDVDIEVDTLIQITNDTNWLKITNINYNSIAVKTDGSLWTWGFNNYFEFYSDSTNGRTPHKIGAFGCTDVVANNSGVVILDTGNAVRSVGRYLNSDRNNESNPVAYSPSGKLINTWGNSFAVYWNDHFQVWGINSGLKFTKDIKSGIVEYPTGIKSDLSFSNMKGAAEVGNGFVVIDSAGNMVAWGDNSSADLTNGIDSYYKEPSRLMPNKLFKDVSAGDMHSLAIDEFGMLWTWGRNNQNQLGTDNLEDVSYPINIDYSHDWEKVFSFNNSNFAIKEDGSMWAWGDNSHGKLGIGHNEMVRKPTKVADDGPWLKVHSSTDHTLALKKDSTLWVWGRGNSKMGIGLDSVFYPHQVGTDNDWIDIGCGEIYSAAVKVDYSYWCWGSNSYGTFGHYKNQGYSKPTKPDMWTTEIVKMMSAGRESVLLVADNDDLHIFAPAVCGGASIHPEPTGYNYIHSNYEGLNSIISNIGQLYFSTSSSGSNSFVVDITNTHSYLVNEDINWVKAQIGRDFAVGLKDEGITTNINSIQSTDNIIYPNPSKSNIEIDLSDYYSNIELIIYDIDGTQLINKKYYNSNHISLRHNLESGTYIIKCFSENKTIISELFNVLK